MPNKKMKTNQDGGSVTAKDPGAAAKELKKNEDSAAKMGYNQKFGAARISPSKMGDAKAGELMQGAARYYDGAGQYMNGAPKYEGAAKHHGPMKEHGPMKGHEGPMDMHKGPMDKHEGPMDKHGGPMDMHEGPMDMHKGPMKKKLYEGPGDHGPNGTHPIDINTNEPLVKGSSITVGKKVLRPEDFYDKPAAQRVRSNLAAQSTDPITDAPSPIQIDKFGFSTNPNQGKREAENLSLAIREVRRKPITKQETKFEETFGLRKFDGLKPFLDTEPTNQFARSRPRSEKSADTFKAYKEGPVAQRYQENVNIAKQQLEKEKGFQIGSKGTTIKSVSSQLKSSANNATSELQKKAAGLTAAQNINKPKPKKKKPKSPYSLASVAVQALKVPFTTRAFGARQGAINEIKRKADLATMPGYKKRIL